jgi:hypothetical protein
MTKERGRKAQQTMRKKKVRETADLFDAAGKSELLARLLVVGLLLGALEGGAENVTQRGA